MLDRKSSLRRHIRETLANYSAEQLLLASSLIVDRLLAMPPVAAANTIMIWFPLPGEVDLSSLADWLWQRPAPKGAGRLALPRVDWTARTITPVIVNNLSTDCVPGRYSLREPKADLDSLALDDLDVVVVPGLAFDVGGFRLGRGGGFYDRLLAQLSELPADRRAQTIGVCLDEQVINRVPREAHDLRVDMMVTPTRTIVCV